MLAKKYRLRREDTVRKKSHAITSSYFRAKIYSTGRAYSRFSVHVGKAVYKKAHERNALRRSIYSFIRENRKHISLNDIVLIALPKTKILKTKNSLIAHLQKLFKSI